MSMNALPKVWQLTGPSMSMITLGAIGRRLREEYSSIIEEPMPSYLESIVNELP